MGYIPDWFSDRQIWRPAHGPIYHFKENPNLYGRIQVTRRQLKPELIIIYLVTLVDSVLDVAKIISQLDPGCTTTIKKSLFSDNCQVIVSFPLKELTTKEFTKIIEVIVANTAKC